MKILFCLKKGKKNKWKSVSFFYYYFISESDETGSCLKDKEI